MKRILAAAAGLLIGTSAYAAPVTIVVDDFSHSNTQTVVDTSPDAPDSSDQTTYTIDGNTFTRTLVVNQLSTMVGGESRGFIGDPDLDDGIDASVFSMTNADGVDSTMELVYDIDALTDDFSGESMLNLTVLFADLASGAPFTIEGILNGSSLGSETFTGGDGLITFDLSALLESGNELRLVFNGGTSWDATLDDITVLAESGGGGIPVPEPGAIGLLGLGLAGVALGRRRKTA